MPSNLSTLSFSFTVVFSHRTRCTKKFLFVMPWCEQRCFLLTSAKFVQAKLKSQISRESGKRKRKWMFPFNTNMRLSGSGSSRWAEEHQTKPEEDDDIHVSQNQKWLQLYSKHVSPFVYEHVNISARAGLDAICCHVLTHDLQVLHLFTINWHYRDVSDLPSPVWELVFLVNPTQSDKTQIFF